jgi:hypothetical protein
MRPVPAELPAHLTYSFYAIAAWGLSATFAAFRILAGENVKRAMALRVAIVVWLAVPAVLAVRGVFLNFTSVPPNLLRLVLPMLLIVVALCASPWGRYAAEKLPTSLLVGTQAFRFPLELVLYGLAAHGLLSSEMTLLGYNFDIVTGILALPLWWSVRRLTAPRWALLAWNALGFVLLVVVLTIAILSFPVPFGWFDPPNLIVAFYPWVWLPTFLVPIALCSHILLMRKLLMPESPPAANV